MQLLAAVVMSGLSACCRGLRRRSATEKVQVRPTGALDVDNFFETEHHERSRIANLLQPILRLYTSHTPQNGLIGRCRDE
jgi:hypothetical protein